MAEGPEPPAVTFEECGAVTRIDLRVYRLAALKKTAYRLAALCTAVIGAPEGESVSVRLLFAPRTTPEDVREGVRRFFEELLDQELREQVAEETAPLRVLILANAFSKTDLIRR